MAVGVSVSAVYLSGCLCQRLSLVCGSSCGCGCVLLDLTWCFSRCGSPHIGIESKDFLSHLLVQKHPKYMEIQSYELSYYSTKYAHIYTRDLSGLHTYTHVVYNMYRYYVCTRDLILCMNIDMQQWRHRVMHIYMYKCQKRLISITTDVWKETYTHTYIYMYIYTCSHVYTNTRYAIAWLTRTCTHIYTSDL